MTSADRVISIATAEIGYLEKASNKDLDSKTANAGHNNYTKYARDLDGIPNFYNGKKQGFDWCDIFVDWCFVQAFGVSTAKKLLLQPDKSCGAGCKFSAGYYKSAGQFHSTPKVGDQIFFGCGSSVTHTGIVYKVDANKVYTIEGNTSGASGVISNGGGVCRKSYALNYKRIYGYGRPAYSAESSATPTTSAQPAKTKVDPAKSFSKSYAKTYKVTAAELNMRAGAGVNKPVLTTLKRYTRFQCYGYYTQLSDGSVWLYGVANGIEGFCSKKYLV